MHRLVRLTGPHTQQLGCPLNLERGADSNPGSLGQTVAPEASPKGGAEAEGRPGCCCVVESRLRPPRRSALADEINGSVAVT